MYLSVTAIIESVRSQKDRPGRFRVALVGTTAVAAAYLGLASAMGIAPARWELAAFFFVFTALLGFLGLVTALMIWKPQNAARAA